MKGGKPEDVAVTPDGKEVYIVNSWTSGSTVNVLDRSFHTLLPLPNSTGFHPTRVVFTTIVF